MAARAKKINRHETKLYFYMGEKKITEMTFCQSVFKHCTANRIQEIVEQLSLYDIGVSHGYIRWLIETTQ